MTALLGTAAAARATPSTVVWTPATTYTQPFLIPHITYDTYFADDVMYPVDVGLTVGFVPDNKWVEGELGVDAFYPLARKVDPNTGAVGGPEAKNAFQFNGKLSLKEGSLHEYAPGLSAGISNVGLVKDTTESGLRSTWAIGAPLTRPTSVARSRIRRDAPCGLSAGTSPGNTRSDRRVDSKPRQGAWPGFAFAWPAEEHRSRRLQTSCEPSSRPPSCRKTSPG
mgnify:CR=1 FL=1